MREVGAASLSLSPSSRLSTLLIMLELSSCSQDRESSGFRAPGGGGGGRLSAIRGRREKQFSLPTRFGLLLRLDLYVRGCTTPNMMNTLGPLASMQGPGAGVFREPVLCGSPRFLIGVPLAHVV